jgi:hypothetical protein
MTTSQKEVNTPAEGHEVEAVRLKVCGENWEK